MKRNGLVGLAAVVMLVAAVATTQRVLGQSAVAGKVGSVPLFEVDPSWPKLPNNWVMGLVSSVAVDSRDHVWILHRPRVVPAEKRKDAAPPVLEFDANGKFVQAWGGPAAGIEWPDSEHGIYVDDKDGIWIGGSSRKGAGVCEGGKCARNDDMLTKFTAQGKFVMQIGHRDQGTGSKDQKNVHAATDVFVYRKTNELFVSDGYQGPGPQGNCRVVVFDANTGAFKRYFGAFGNAPQCDATAEEGDGGGGRGAAPALETTGPGPKQFASVHGIELSNDGLVYVADRGNRRIQIFDLSGNYIDQVFINRAGPNAQSAAGLAFSTDPDQKFMYVADYGNSHIVVVDRKSLKVLYQFGVRSAKPGDFQGIHNIAVDSKGNLYTAEVAPGARAQRFVFKGLGTAPAPAN
jgi:DNA-binding beta-propeller fold protein YncE